MLSRDFSFFATQRTMELNVFSLLWRVVGTLQSAHFKRSFNYIVAHLSPMGVTRC